MLSKESESLYRVVINYDTSSVSVSVARGAIVEGSVDITPPSILDSLFGATIEKRIHKAARNAQKKCDELNDKLYKIFDALFGNAKMKDTKIPLKIICTNLKNAQKRVFDKDDDIYIKDAVLATMAIPGVFEEPTIEGEVYGDGFLCENLGISEASYDTVLAVDVLGKNAFNPDMPNNFFKTANVLEMFEKSMRLLIYNQTKILMQHSTKDIYLLEPMTREYKTFHFNKIKEIYALGLGLL